jgi:hypothetical protein
MPSLCMPHQVTRYASSAAIDNICDEPSPPSTRVSPGSPYSAKADVKTIGAALSSDQSDAETPFRALMGEDLVRCLLAGRESEWAKAAQDGPDQDVSVPSGRSYCY